VTTRRERRRREREAKKAKRFPAGPNWQVVQHGNFMAFGNERQYVRMVLQGRCDRCKKSIGGLFVFMENGRPLERLFWAGAQGGRYVDAPTARHQPVDQADLAGFVDVLTMPPPVTLEAFCPRHGPRSIATDDVLAVWGGHMAMEEDDPLPFVTLRASAP
jgi:hypothetical protein